jgi:ribosomal protein S20
MSDMTRRLAAAALCLGVTMGLGGCRHRVVLAPLPPVQTPVEPIESSPLAKAPMVEAPQIDLPPAPIAAAARPIRERKRPAKAATATPVVPEAAPAAPVTPPQENAIGALTAGGETNPQSKQEAADLIASIEKRLNTLPAQVDENDKAQVSKVKNFWRDAQEALKSGDAEGAMTLATKAKLLLDDMEK